MTTYAERAEMAVAQRIAGKGIALNDLLSGTFTSGVWNESYLHSTSAYVGCDDGGKLEKELKRLGTTKFLSKAMNRILLVLPYLEDAGFVTGDEYTVEFHLARGGMGSLAYLQKNEHGVWGIF